MFSFRRESTRAIRRLVLSLLVVGIIAPLAFAAPADHLIISEVVVKTRAPVTTFGSPFIEIVNPTGSAVPMDDVYLTDGTTAPAVFYYNITLLDPATANPGGGFGGDFHARFPAGYVMAAGDTIAIAVNGSTEYVSAYGVKPDFELFEDGLIPDDIPELVEAYQGSINAGLGGSGNVPVLSDVAESLILYTWDGSADLVQDLDYVMWGTNNSVRFDKSSVTIGGGTYLPDTPVASQTAAAASGPTFGQALTRLGIDEGTETTIGGNGATGHDETSENLATTVPTVAGHTPPLAGTLHPAAPIFTAADVSPAAPAEGQAVTLSVTTVDQDEVETAVFYFSVNGGAYQGLGGSAAGPGVFTASIPAQTENDVVTWYCVATNTESTEAIYPAGAPNFATGWTVGPGVVPGDGPAKLLLTEISTVGTEQEYIEIYNPGATEVDLSDYYLTDANYATGDQYYFNIGLGNPTQVTVGGGAFSDFHARFPDGFSIAAGDTIVVTVAGSIAFNSNFGFDPDLELWEDDASADAVPDMRWIFGTAGDNSIISSGSTPTLTNGAETVILYHFVTGQSKVTDIDVFTWKDPNESTTTSHYFNKTGRTIGSHSYLPEKGTNESDAFNTMNAFGNSYHRTDPNEGGQTPTGSNGVGGSDETSENCNTNFAMMPYDPAGPSGEVPVVDPEKLLVTEVCTKDTGAEFIEITNPGTKAVNMADYYLTDAVYATASQYYWQIALGNPSTATVGGGTFGDFHARFPGNFSLAAGDTITIALGGSTAFSAAYGYLPDLEMYEDDAAADAVPDMAFIFGDATNNSIINRTGTASGQPSTPGLTDAAESVILYYWQAGQDRVVDIDVVIWKDALSTSESFLFSKTGVTIGAHAYLPDTDTTAQTPFNSETDPGFSYHRTDGNEGTQKPTGSNGVGGRDETSENFNGTFQMATADPARPAPPPEPTNASKLLLTEISTIGTAQEFIEIYNPGNQPVDLSDYYLTDANYSSGDQYYFNIGRGNPSQVTIGGGAFSDFHARFPDGYTIAAGDTIVVSVPGSDSYEESFGFLPHLELYEDGDYQDNIPDMRWVFGTEGANSIISADSSPTLTNGAETVILYHFVEGENQVTDIDVFTWKDPSSTTSSIYFNKTGRTIGSHSYLPEKGTSESDAFGAQNDFGNSYHRIDATEGDQTPTGSNGVGGRDETSEDLNATFAMMAYDPSPSFGGTGPGDGPGDLPLQLVVPARTYLPNMDAGFPIRFTSRPQDYSETKVRIFDLEGRLILTVFDSRFDGNPPTDIDDPSQKKFEWDGRDSTFELVRGGLYVVHMSVVGIREGNEEEFTAPVVVGTRLSK